MPYPKTIVVTAAIFFAGFLFTKCFRDNVAVSKDPRGELYAGSTTCAGCHPKISESFSHNDHYRTSSKVNAAGLEKIIKTPADDFYFMDSSHIRFEKEDSSFFQSYFVNGKKMLARKFDIAFGSGEKAQTYAGWNEDKLFQLPLTYFTQMKTWANSPGFPASHARFDRVITSRCFECHSSYIGKEIVQSGSLSVSEKLAKNTVMYGINCERCHGPASAHVKFQQENPLVKTAKYITAIKSLSRQQQLDVCATCHAGNDQSSQRSIFSFVPGDTLSHFYYPEFAATPQPDVHGKQMQLLQSSKCFRQSNMTCGSCHSQHETEKNNTAIFISKCMNCHQASMHALEFVKKMKDAKDNVALEKTSCINCHMPLQVSKSISFNDGSKSKNIAYYLRTHKIAVYKNDVATR